MKIPKELKNYYYTTDLEKLKDEPMDFFNFTRYVLLLRRMKKLNDKEIIMALEHYNADYNGENPHAECICEGIGRSIGSDCPDVAH